MAESKRCAVCSGPLDNDARFCSSCGTATPTGEHPTPELSESAPGEFEARVRTALRDEYELLELVGSGGFARVFKARDIRLGRLVAVKVIRPEYAGATVFLDRFRREGVALAKLRHPGIVPIYDIRERDGLIYYIMPFVEGPTLRARLDKSQSIPPHEAHRIFNELSDAIAAAHRVGVVHRDIKPDNVILEGNLGNVLLMDFGIAKAVADEEEGLTASGVLVGTPRYMSPEQASGGEVDQRSDIYSLGVLAYEMVTGRLPFDGENTQELIAQHLTKVPVAVRHINPSVPKALAEVVQKCMQKEPADRFPDASELSSRLQAVRMFDVRVEEAATGSPGPRRKMLAAVFALGLIGGIGAISVFSRLAPAPPAPADTPLAYARSWLDLAVRAASVAASDSVVGELQLTFAPDPDIRFVAIEPTHAATVTDLRPDRVPTRTDLMDLLRSVDPHRLVERRIGESAVVSATVGGPEEVGCGTLILGLQPEGEQWYVNQLAVVDFGIFCPPPDSAQ